VGLPASGSRGRAGAMSCRTTLCHAHTFTHTQSLRGSPKPSLAVVVLALAQALLCSDLAVPSHHRGKPGPWQGFSATCPRCSTGLEPAGCLVSARHPGWVVLSPPCRERPGMQDLSGQPCRAESSSDFRVQKEVEGAAENEGAAGDKEKVLGAAWPLSDPRAERSRLGKPLGNALL